MVRPVAARLLRSKPTALPRRMLSCRQVAAGARLGRRAATALPRRQLPRILAAAACPRCSSRLPLAVAVAVPTSISLFVVTHRRGKFVERRALLVGTAPCW